MVEFAMVIVGWMGAIVVGGMTLRTLVEADIGARGTQASVLLGFAIVGLIVLGGGYGMASYAGSSGEIVDAETSGVVSEVECCTSGAFTAHLEDSANADTVDSIVLTNSNGEYVDDESVVPNVRRAELHPPMGADTTRGEWSVAATDDDTVIGSATYTVEMERRVPLIPKVQLGLAASGIGAVGGIGAILVEKRRRESTKEVAA